MFAKDSDVVINGGSFYNISGGSTECDEITFTGEKKVTLGASVEYVSASDIVENAAGDATGDGIVNLLDVIRIIKSITDEGIYVHPAADVNKDGVINVYDALIIVKSIINGN